MDKKKIEAKLKELREQWVKYPEKRKIIELQAKILKKIVTPQPGEKGIYENH